MELDPTTPDVSTSPVDLLREIRELKVVVIQLQKDMERGYRIIPPESGE